MAVRRPKSWAICVLAALVAGSAPGNLQAAGELTLKYFRELRARRLYSVAERACMHWLSQPRLSPVERADLTMELSETLVEHAAYVGDADQKAMWSRASEVLTDLLEKESENPRAVLLEAHLALIPAAEANWCRWQAELLPYEPGYGELARKAIETAVPQLLGVERRLLAMLRSPRKDLPADSPMPFELRGLLAKVSFHRAQAEMDRAVLPGTVPADRAAALVQAEKLLRTLAETHESQDVLWQSRILNVQCLRLMGDLPRARRALAGYESQSPPGAASADLAAEKIRMLQVDQAAEARKQLDAALSAGPQLTDQLALLKTQQLAESLRRASAAGSPDVKDRERELREFVERAQREVGGFWSYRCALVQQQVEDELSFGPEVAPIVRKAEVDFQAGHLDAALAGYSQAIARSEEAGRMEQAFELAYTRASVAIEAKRWPEAAAGLQKLIGDEAKHPKAAEVSLLRAYALGRWYEEKPTQAHRQAYTAALHEHRKSFPEHATAGEATWMLANLEAGRNQVTAALKLFGEIPDDHARGPEARLKQAQCYPQIIDRLRELKRSTEAWESEAVRRLKAMLPADRSAAMTGSQIEIALVLARIQLELPRPEYSAADGVLAQVFDSLAKLPAVEGDAGESRRNLQSQAMRLRIVSLAAQGQPQEARRLLSQLSATEPRELLRILEALGPLTSQVAEGARDELGRLQLEASQKLAGRRESLAAADQRRLDECLAQAYLATGQPEQALDLYARASQGNPDDTSLIERYAKLLERAGGTKNVESALTLWKKLEAAETPGSPSWMRRRLHVCTRLLELDQKLECRQRLTSTLLLYPDLGSEEIAREFEALESRLNK